MSKTKEVAQSTVTKMKVAPIEGERKLHVIATSPRLDRDKEVIDSDTIRVPLKSGGWKYLKDMTNEDKPDIPFLLDHSWSLEKQAGSLDSIFINTDGKTEAVVSVSSVDNGERVYTLAKEGNLGNSFSIGMSLMDSTFADGTWYNVELMELSAVFKGANPDAVLLAVKGIKEKSMSDIDTKKAEIARLQKEVQDAEKVEVPVVPEVPVVEAPAAAVPEVEEPQKEEVEDTPDTPTEEKETKSVKKETKIMADAKDIAVKQVIAPADQATVEVKANAMDYLKTTDAVLAYTKAMADHPGKGNASRVQETFKAHLESKGITNPSILVPEPIISKISDEFEKGGRIWNLVNKTGLKALRVAKNTNTGDTSRARGHVRGATKDEQVITLAARTLRPGMIYKYLTLDRETVLENEGNEAGLMDYVLTELPKQVLNELERAIVIGDGRADGPDKVTSFLSILDDAGTADGYATTYTPLVGEALVRSVLKADGLVKAEGARYLITSRETLADLRLSETSGGNFIFPLGSDVPGSLGFAGVLTPEWFDEQEDAQAIIAVLGEYDTVGQATAQQFSNFLLKTNTYEWLQEIYAGGALTEGRSAVVVAPTPSA